MARKTVLIVEDNFDSRVILATVLKRAAYRVIEAADGQQAIALLAENVPDLILLDIALPKADGWTVAMFARDNESTRTVPIVAITSTETSEDRERAERFGFEEYFCKPVIPFEVVRRVESIIGPERRGAERRAGGDRRFAPREDDAPTERRSGSDRRADTAASR